MLGDRIQALRCQQGLTQAELARRLCTSPSAIGMYEQGRREPPLDTVVHLAREFGVTTDYLLTGRCVCPEDFQTGSQALCRMFRELQESIHALFPDLGI